jgi:hypothetical protein
MIISRKMIKGHVARMRQMINACNISGLLHRVVVVNNNNNNNNENT